MSDGRIEAQLKTAGEMLDALRLRTDGQIAYIAKLEAQLETVRDAERERCAKVTEPYCSGNNNAARRVAIAIRDAIRARPDTEVSDG